MNIKNKGFTLIELLVAIIIVSVISTIGVASYTGYVRNSRDISRKSSLMQIKAYLDQYYSANLRYPECVSCLSNSGQGVWVTGLQSYTEALPTDPLNEPGSPMDGKQSFLYRSFNDGQSYDLIGLLENHSDPIRCEIINYKGGPTDSNLLCGSSEPPFSKRIFDVSRGLGVTSN